jgi:hypothetical protein
MDPTRALDDLAAALRERLLGDADVDDGREVRDRIRALVERDAALLDRAERERLVELVAERSFGLGPLEPLLRDPEVDEVMVNGTGPVWVERAGGSSAPPSASPRTPTCVTRSSASSRRSDGGWTRPSRCATPDCPTARA